MSEHSVAMLVLSALGGLLVGLLHFAALWWTVRQITSARSPALLLGGSFLVRTTIAAGGIVLVAAGSPLRLAGAVVGFLVARTIMIRVVGAKLPGPGRPVGNRAGENGAGRVASTDSNSAGDRVTDPMTPADRQTADGSRPAAGKGTDGHHT